MPTARTRLITGSAVGALLVAAVVIALTISGSGNTTTRTASLLPHGVNSPTGGSTTTYAPAGLGATVTLPATWKAAPPASGFQYVMESRTASEEFLGASRQSGFVPLSAATVARQREAFLRSIGATITSEATGTIDGKPAVRLRYLLTAGHTTVDDSEYDIITNSTLPVGASQEQTEYDNIVFVLGAPVNTDRSVLQWIASTIRIPG